MSKLFNIFGCSACFTLMLFSFAFSQTATEQLVITSYYPSPSGSYRQLSVTDNDTSAGRTALTVSQTGAIIGGTGYAISATKTGASTNNVAGYFSASGATNNYALITESGLVGIGTTAPGTLTEIERNTVNGEDVMLLLHNAENTYSNGHGASIAFGNQLAGELGGSRISAKIGGFGEAGTGTPGHLAFYVRRGDGDVPERMRIDTNGNVGIGTTGPTFLAAKGLEISGASGGIRLTGARSYELISGGGPGALQLWDVAANVQRVTLDASGNVGIGTTSPGFTLTVNGTAWCTAGAWASDLRWKENITTLDNPLEKLLRLRGVEFDWKRKEFKDKNFPQGRQIGIIAQELEKEFPELVVTDKDGYKAIAYDKLTVVLLEGMKAQQAQMQAQAKQIETLKQEINRLKKGER